MNDLEVIRDALDIALLRVEAGQPLAQALDDAPASRCERRWVERWVELRDRLLKGEASLLHGLTNFRRSVDLQLKIRRLVRKRSLLPTVQAISVGLSSLLFLAITQTLFADLFRLRREELAISIGLLLFGYAWIWRLLRSYEKDLWFIDWLEFVSGLATGLSWGQSLLTGWKRCLEGTRRLPPELSKFLEDSFARAECFEALERARPSSDKLVARCQLRWEQVHRLFVSNERVLPVLQREIENAFEHFQDGLERKAELLSAKLMLPLFFCFVPAYLIMLLAPLIRPLLASQ